MGWFKSYDVPVAVICVGNLKAGGTGKTPVTQYLLNMFAEKYKTAVLSRGYGRSTKGFIYADSDSTANEIGDEPLQLYSHATGRYSVVVCEDRVEGVKQLLLRIPDLQLVILDDGYQHRRIKRDVNLLLTEYKDPFFADWVLPAGRLRECRNGASRADAIIVTKTPVGSKPLAPDFFQKYTKSKTTISYSAIAYGIFRNQEEELSVQQQEKIILVTGIANAKPLLEYLYDKSIDIEQHVSFKDHYTYTEADIHAIEELSKSNSGLKIITTEKDWVKIVPLLKKLKTSAIWGYLPIELNLYSEEQKLLSVIDSKIIQRLQGLTHSA
jgi:tetraacyldisaccharide 4'-kinase